MARVFNDRLKNNITLRTLLIYVIFAIYFVSGIISSTPVGVQKWFALTNEIIYWIMLAVLFLDLFIAFALKEYKPTVLVVVFVIIGVLSWIFCGSTAFLFLVGMGLLFERYGYQVMIEKSLKILELTFIGIIIASFLTIIPNWEYPRTDTIVRYSLGFVYPTVVSSRFLYLIMLKMMVRKSDVTYVELTLYGIIGYLIYQLTDSRTGFYLIVFALIIWAIGKICRNVKIEKFINNKVFYYCVILVPVILALLSIVSSMMYDANSTVWLKINGWLSDRLRLSNDAITKYGANLLGQDIEWYGWGGYGHIEMPEAFVYNYVDNAYLKQLLDRGIVGLIFLLSVYMMCIHKAFNEKRYWVLVILLIILVQAVIDDFLMDVNSGNLFVLIMSSYLIKPVKNIKTELDKENKID